MSNLLKENKLSNHISELKKTKHLSGISSIKGRYPFYVCSPQIRKSDMCDKDGESVLLSTGGEAVIHFANGKYSYSADVWGLEGKNGLTTRYLYWILLKLRNDVNYKNFQGSGIKHLDKKSFKKRSFYLPDIENQMKISKILFSIEEALQASKLKLKKYQDLRLSLLHKYFDKIANNPSHGWKTYKLESIAKRGTGHTPKKVRSDFWDGGVKWVSLSDTYRLDSMEIFDTDKKISQLGILNSSAVLHPKGTVILLRDAGVGKSAILGEEMAVSQHFVVWRCSDQLNNLFLYYWLQYKKNAFERVAMGSTIPTIGMGYFKKLEIKIPDIHQQMKVSQILKSADETIASFKEYIIKLELIKKSTIEHLVN